MEVDRINMSKTLDTTKRYWMFGGEDYYPAGGMKDFVKAFDTLPEALQNHDWVQVFDTETGRIVANSEEGMLLVGPQLKKEPTPEDVE